MNTAESRVIEVAGRDVLLVKRFDREKVTEGYLRARMVSSLTLLRAEDTYQSRDKWSYVLLAEELRRVSAKPQEDAPELFRRMCFNALISNIDGHPRNYAIIAKERDWLLSQSPRFLLKQEDARKIIDEMEIYIRSAWYSVVRGAGVSERDCEQITGAFTYIGFRLKIGEKNDHHI